MRVRLVFAAAGIVTLGALGMASPAGAAPPSGQVCSGTLASPEILAPGVYSSLSMPPGSACGVVTGAVTITHPLALSDGSALAVFAGSHTVAGPVTVGPNAFFGDAGSVAPITVGGPITVEDNGALVIGSETPGGPLLSAIRGPVRRTDVSTVQIHNTAISGPVNLQGGRW